MTVLRLLSLAILALAATTAHAQAKELVMGNVNPPKHGTALASQQFIDKLAELTVIRHHSGALGGEREVGQQVQLGTGDFSPMTAAPLSTLVPEMSVFQLTYIFRDFPHVYAALDGTATLKKSYDRILGKKGVPSAAC
jgi:TRAP-type C4-dicarboxylate transport system substrate-binding protein